MQDYGAMINSFGQGQTAMAAQRANTGLVQQQTQQAAMQNQIMQARMPMVMHIINDFTNQTDHSGEQPAVPSDDTSLPGQAAQPDQSGVAAHTTSALSAENIAKIDASLAQKFFVDPKGTEQEQQNIAKGTFIDPETGKMYATIRDNAVGSRVAHSQFHANNLYNAFDAVTEAAPSGALYALDAVAPNTAAQIRKDFADPSEQDGAARAFAAHVAGATHMYTGRKAVARTDGTYVDEQTGKPVPGVERSGLSLEQWSALAEKGLQPVDVHNTDGSVTQVPTWQSPQSGNGAQSLADWVSKVAQRGGVPGAQPTVGGGVGAATRATIGKVAGQAKPPANASAAAPAGPPSSPTADPVLSAALADKAYRDPALAPGKANSTPSTIQKGTQDTYVAQRKELQQNGSDLATAASSALTNFQAAQRILGAPDGSHINAIQGLPGAIAHRLASLGYDTDTADHRAEVAKYLTQAAVANLKETYGGKPGVYDVKVNLEKAFPNVEDMPYGALQDLVKSQVVQANYVKDLAGRIPGYLNAGNTPTSFADWNNKYFPRSKALEEGMTGEKAGALKWTPAQIKKYADTHFSGNTAKATQWLLQHK